MFKPVRSKRGGGYGREAYGITVTLPHAEPRHPLGKRDGPFAAAFLRQIVTEPMTRARLSAKVRPTIHDVARLAGVSAMTVSNVVNAKGHASLATKEKVESAIAELGYSPNTAARQLVGAKATRIGLICAAGDTPFLGAVLTGSFKAAARRGVQLLLRDGNSVTSRGAKSLAQELVADGAEALILVPPYAELLNGSPYLRRLAIPCCAIATAGPLSGMDCVRIDNRVAMRELTTRMLAKGHRRIGFIAGPPANGDSETRLNGFKDALAEHDIPFSHHRCATGQFNFASGVAAARELLDRDPSLTAIVASNDDMAAGVLSEAHRRGLNVPADLAVTGFDDTSLATRLWPPLTAVRQPIDAMAARAVERLLELLAVQKEACLPRDEIFPHSIVERASSATPSPPPPSEKPPQ